MKVLITGASGFIGTHVVTQCAKKNIPCLNIDKKPPLDPSHHTYWEKGDIENVDALKDSFQAFNPTHVLHLAARTDCDENTTVDTGYRVNTEGTKNVLTAIRRTVSVSRAIITSSQYVCGPDHRPSDINDYGPHTVYGQSKVLTEKFTKEAQLSCCWTLIRPTNIWGPWHMRYKKEFWSVLKKGLYLHPGGRPVIRCYGYVGNVVHQIMRIFNALEGNVNLQTFYVGDPAMDIYQWTNGFSLKLKKKPVRVVPRFVLQGLGAIGDVARLLSAPFPITTSRYQSMTTDYLTPMDKTFEVLGYPQISLEQGIEETVQWLKKCETENKEMKNPIS